MTSSLQSMSAVAEVAGIDVPADPVRASQQVFRLVLDALANPGRIHQLVTHPLVRTGDGSYNPWLASVLVTLLDHEVTLHVADAPPLAGLGSFIVQRTKTTLSGADEATFVVARADSALSNLPERMRRGSLEYPDDGATLLLLVDAISDGAGLRLTGPGIASEATLQVDGLPVALLESRERANGGYPMGVDLLLVDTNGRIAGLPRTTRVTVLTEGRN
jgi:alpha-D-ribose 1-methylphosphonate 5-triphosphate synthase subunit PhnH